MGHPSVHCQRPTTEALPDAQKGLFKKCSQSWAKLLLSSSDVQKEECLRLAHWGLIWQNNQKTT